MELQEIIAFAIVVAAGFFTAWKFVRQFTAGDQAEGKCAKCELQKAVKAGPNGNDTPAVDDIR